MKYFEPGERFSFLWYGNRFLIYRPKDQKYVRIILGIVFFTDNKRKATRWKYLDQAIAWARKMKLA